MFFRNSPRHEFIPGLSPVDDEKVFVKKTASTFAEESLINFLVENQCSKVVLVGFTANECIDASAKQAADLGFDVVVVSDGCATFDLYGPDRQLVEATRVHQLTMANLGAFFATIVTTENVLK
jgi:nicotinamidase-related amidase